MYTSARLTVVLALAVLGYLYRQPFHRAACALASSSSRVHGQRDWCRARQVSSTARSPVNEIALSSPRFHTARYRSDASPVSTRSARPLVRSVSVPSGPRVTIKRASTSVGRSPWSPWIRVEFTGSGSHGGKDLVDAVRNERRIEAAHRCRSVRAAMYGQPPRVGG